MRSKSLPIVVLVIMLFITACTPVVEKTPEATQQLVQPQSETATIEVQSQPTETVAPTEKPTALPDPVSLTVMAAASLTESFTLIGEKFETLYPWVTITYNFAGSQTLAEQINQGAPADVFASANTKQMNAVVETGIIKEGVPQIFVTNRLVVIFPADNPAGITELKDLAKPGVKIILADETVPVGNYSIAFLEKASESDEFGAQFKDDVLKNVVSYENNVKSVLAKVVLGEADAGIVYISDITTDVSSKVEKIDIPDDLNTIANYPIAPLSTSKNPEMAQLFVDYILSAECQEIFASFNFVPVKK